MQEEKSRCRSGQHDPLGAGWRVGFLVIPENSREGIFLALRVRQMAPWLWVFLTPGCILKIYQASIPVQLK